MSDEIRILDINEVNTESLLAFSDRVLGENYISKEEFDSIKETSKTPAGSCSLALVNRKGTVFGLRLSFPPGAWTKGKGVGLTPQKWNSKLEETAYFQSLFVDPTLTGRGLGPKMSRIAIKRLKLAGAKAIVCHSWVESPNQSSKKYLTKLGFESVAVHKMYWKNVDYTCTRCGKPCLCSAEEMILNLKE